MCYNTIYKERGISMTYESVVVDCRPTTAPEHFCVFVYDEESKVFCPIRKKLLKAAPEEIVRQWWIYRLKEVYGYSFDQMDVDRKSVV